MDAVSYAHSAKQAKRIKMFIENPDSNSGVLTQPKVIEAGETVTIKSGRQAILADTVVDGDLVIEAGGDVFVPAGAGFGDLESQIALKADTSYVNGKYSGFKNYIINGGFDVWQRGTSQTAAGYGSDDRWGNYNAGSTKTHSLVACTDTERALFNAAYFSRTVVSSVVGASNFTHKSQSIEDVTRLAGKTVTISFWARASSTLNIQLNIAQHYGTGGSPSTKTPNPQTPIQLTSAWQKKTVTINIPSIVGKTLGTNGVHTSYTQLYFILEADASWISGVTIGQQSGTFDIAQVQVEEGSVATPFENRPYGLELSLCQRYYEKGRAVSVSYGSSGVSYQRGHVAYLTEKRSAPSVILTKNAGEATGGGITNGDSTGFSFGYVSTDSSQEWIGTYTANAEL